MAISLNKVGINLNRSERLRVNENWTTIENELEKAKGGTELAELAKLAADDAQAKADSIRQELNEVVVSGDSGPQAAQASVGADGTSYDGNLKARLDAEHNKVAEKLAEKVDQVVQDGTSLRFYSNGYMVSAIDMSEAGNSDVVKTYVDSLVSEGKIEGITLAEKSVDETKTTFARVGKNKFHDSYEIGFAIFADNKYQTTTGNGLVALIKAEKLKTYTVSKGEGGDRFRVSTSVGKPQVDQYLSRMINSDDSKSSVTLTLQGDEDYILVYVKSGEGSTAPKWLQVEEGTSATTYVPPSTRYEIEERSIEVSALKGVHSTAILTGESRSFNVDLDQEKITTKNAGGFINVGTERYKLKDGEWNYSHVSANTIIVVYKISTEEIGFYNSSEITDRNNFKHPIIGVIRKDDGTCHINGIYSFKNSTIKPFTAKVKNSMITEAFLTGSSSAFIVDLNNQNITTATSGGFINVGNSYYPLKVAHYSFSDFSSNTVMAMFNTETRDLEFYSLSTVNSLDRFKYGLVGIIRRDEKRAFMNGIHKLIGEQKTLDTKPFAITDMPSIEYTPDSEYVSDSHTIQADDIYSIFDSLSDNYPDYVTKELLITESSGLPIYLYHFIPPNPIEYSGDNLPWIYYQSGIHGHEKVSAMGGALFFRELVERWKEDDVLRSLRWNVRFTVIPVLNPYGFNNNQRKNANGVDLNRNWGAGWKHENDSTSWYYQGEESFSEIETQAVRDNVMSNNNIDFAIDHHNGPDMDANIQYAYWAGTNNEHGKKVVGAIGQQMTSYLKKSFSYIDQGNSSHNRVSGAGDGTTAKQWESLGVPAMLLEMTPKLLNGNSQDLQKFTTYATGNTIASILRHYRQFTGKE